MRIVSASSCVFLLVFGACSDDNLGTSSKSGDKSSVNDPGDTSSFATDDGGENSGSGSAICTQYLKCVGDADPSALPVALQAYGPNGSCWGGDGSLVSTCDNACTSSMADLLKAYPNVVSCGGVAPVGDAGLTSACESCANTACPTQLSTCLADPACVQILACDSQCPTTDSDDQMTCQQACHDTSSPGFDHAIALFGCAVGDGKCSGACNTL